MHDTVVLFVSVSHVNWGIVALVLLASRGGKR